MIWHDPVGKKMSHWDIAIFTYILCKHEGVMSRLSDTQTSLQAISTAQACMQINQLIGLNIHSAVKMPQLSIYRNASRKTHARTCLWKSKVMQLRNTWLPPSPDPAGTSLSCMLGWIVTAMVWWHAPPSSLPLLPLLGGHNKSFISIIVRSYHVWLNAF